MAKYRFILVMAVDVYSLSEVYKNTCMSMRVIMLVHLYYQVTIDLKYFQSVSEGLWKNLEFLTIKLLEKYIHLPV